MKLLQSGFLFLVVGLLAGTVDAQAPTRVRGTISGFDGKLLSVKSRDGKNVAIELARAKLDQLRAYVELYRALGGGWSDQEIRQVIDAARSK